MLSPKSCRCSLGAIADLRSHLAYLDARTSHYERQLIGLASQHEPARRIQGLCGIGPLTASAITASMAICDVLIQGRLESVRSAIAKNLQQGSP
jgi:transposase